MLQCTAQPFATMNYYIEQDFLKFEYSEQLRMRDVISALDNGKVYSVEFFSDGSCVSFEYYHPTGNHGMPCTMRSSFNMKQAKIILSGHRLCSHDIPLCC